MPGGAGEAILEPDVPSLVVVGASRTGEVGGRL